MRGTFSIRSAILIYSLFFTGGLAIIITTFLSWRLGNLTADLYQREIEEAAVSTERFIEEELRYRQRALIDYASFPSITQGVLNPVEHQSDIVSFLSVLSARDGNEGSFTLLDFSGGLIHSTEVGWKPDAAQLERAAPVLADQGINSIHLFLRDEVGRAEIFVPICPGGRRPSLSAEGLLIYEFPLLSIFDDLTLFQQDGIALRLNSLSGTRVWEVGDWEPERALLRSKRFDELDMEIQIQYDDSTAAGIRKQAFTDTLRILLLPILLVIGVGIWLAHRYFDAPLRRLEKASKALGAGTEEDLALGETPLEEIQQLNDAFLGMRNEIHERDERLLRSNKELERFAYVAAHDLREPLRTISNMLGLLEEESGEELSGEYHEYLDMARTRADRMQGMLADLLTMSRLHVDLNHQLVDLNQVVQVAVDALSAKINASNARVEVKPLPQVLGSPNLLSLMVQNLIDNALKFVPPDTQPFITVQASSEDDGRVKLSVADNGIGFKPEYAAKIFEVFTRLHGRGDYGGSGIGLSLVRRVVDLHNGQVHAVSKEGEGATFIIDFPAPKT